MAKETMQSQNPAVPLHEFHFIPGKDQYRSKQVSSYERFGSCSLGDVLDKFLNFDITGPFKEYCFGIVRYQVFL